MGGIVFTIGAFAIFSAASVSSAILLTVLFATLTAGFGYYSFQGKIGKRHGLTLAIFCLMLTVISINKVTEKQDERKAEQARVEHQQQQKEAEKQRLAELLRLW